MTITDISPKEGWRESLTPETEGYLDVLWGKSNANGRPNLLLQHLFDAMAVGELVWDHYLAPGLRARLDEICGGEGRRFFMWLCAAHDLGKASPAFQIQDEGLASKVVAAGLAIPHHSKSDRRGWRHERAGAFLVREQLEMEWGEGGQVDWIWPLVAGHHGVIPSEGELKPQPSTLHGLGEEWAAAQAALLRVITVAAGYAALPDVVPEEVPSRADQLLLSGLMIMADWISSDEKHFGGIDELDKVGVEEARRRAGVAWAKLGLDGGWQALPVPATDPIGERFDRSPRPSQAMVVDVAREIPVPGLVIVEAPMGEGKTEAALAAAEVLASRFGANGVFVGMPTQATTDPMFKRVLDWIDTFDRKPQLALVHGKRIFNEDWTRLLAQPRPILDSEGAGVLDEYGVRDEHPSFDNVCEDGQGDDPCDDSAAPAEWFLGRGRAYLTPVLVATIDQLLFAGTRTKRVMLRYAGLAGKVVILDEVHAADVYMSQFLGEVLTWLGMGRVPVVLLSATLSRGQREDLVRAYLKGALLEPYLKVEDLPLADGYPNVTAAWASEGEPRYLVRSCEPWRDPYGLSVEVVEEDEDDSVGPVVEALRRELADGGCALVIRNTVGRAQETFAALRDVIDGDVRLLHARFAAADRADIAESILDLLGPEGDRPHRMVVVATQIAEQSFDIDADLLISDLAPIDLLLQRAGRLHRHEREEGARPERLRTPRTLVTGFSPKASGPPWLPGGSAVIYGEAVLWRSAWEVLEAAGSSGWVLPDDIPRFVDAVYGATSVLPEDWEEPVSSAQAKWDAKQDQRAAKAKDHLLVRKGHWRDQTLAGLHRLGSTSSDPEKHVRVRDGDSSVEVVLLRRDGEEGEYLSLGGRRLGPNGVRATHDRDSMLAVLGGTVRLPAFPKELSIAAEELGPLGAWNDHPWLVHTKVVVLDAANHGRIGDLDVRYEEALGLQIGLR